MPWCAIPGEVSQLLERILGGDREAEGRLFDLLYTDLRRMAAYQLQHERSNHTLQPTALVHEVYLRIFRQTPPKARSRAHFIALAAQVMRRFLVDHARTKKAHKRGGEQEPVPLNQALIYDERRSDEFLAVHEALERLREWAPRQSQIVEMRYFGGMAEEEIAEYLGVSYRTIKREWAMARAWLHAELSA
ncbi:MAG: extracytoplasmic sigma factor [Bryobacterales bacterium]|nr:extracytoplasmic sigma factor [Bryobacterales bacterium]